MSQFVFWYTLFTSNNLDITNLGFVLLPNHNVINCAFHRAGCVGYQLGFLFRKYIRNQEQIICTVYAV